MKWQELQDKYVRSNKIIHNYLLCLSLLLYLFIHLPRCVTDKNLIQLLFSLFFLTSFTSNVILGNIYLIPHLWPLLKHLSPTNFPTLLSSSVYVSDQQTPRRRCSGGCHSLSKPSKSESLTATACIKALNVPFR